MKIKSWIGRAEGTGEGIAPRFGAALGASLFVLSACSGGAFSTVDEYEEPSDRRDASSEAGPLTDGGDDAGKDAEAGLDASEADAADGKGSDADLEDADAADGNGSDAGDEDGGAEAGAPDASDGGDEEACAPITWYRDGDEDGFGGPVTFEGCEPPEEDVWVTKGGDCHDGNAHVHPGQTKYFAAGYELPGGSDVSFDYDCDGKEQNETEPTSSEAACKAVTVGNCTGSGYLPVNPVRPGNSVNPFCGSATRRTCTPFLGLLGCDPAKIETSVPPLGCR